MALTLLVYLFYYFAWPHLLTGAALVGLERGLLLGLAIFLAGALQLSIDSYRASRERPPQPAAWLKRHRRDGEEPPDLPLNLKIEPRSRPSSIAQAD